MTRTTPFARILAMSALITAGEAVFLLPFMIARVFRPTLLDVFQITNLQLGIGYSIYGFVAMIAYFAGGPLADRFSARILMALALVSTAAGGAVYANIPSLGVLNLLYGFWGVTTILLFWAALIRATREWGRIGRQGSAYGILDGGRGLVAALLASVTVALFSSLLPVDPAVATIEQRAVAFELVIWVVAAFTGAVAVLVLFCVPGKSTPLEKPIESAEPSGDEPSRKLTLSGVLGVIRMPAVWLQAMIILCAYVGYKSIDNVSLFARDVFGYDDVAAAQLSTFTLWMRPVGAVAAGFLADRLQSSRVILGSFGFLIIGNLLLALGVVPPSAAWALITTLAVTCVGINGLRGVYFALFGEAKVPLAFTGSAVGVVSVIGYTPDVFMGPLMGFLTDHSPGALGHQHLYGVVAAFGVLGLLSTLLFRRAARN